MATCLRACAAALLAFASVIAWVPAALAEAVPTAGVACAGAGHEHQARMATSSVHEGRGTCVGCQHGCGPGQCVTPGSLAVALLTPAPAPRLSKRTGYEVASDPLRSTSATPPIPPPQTVL